MTHRSRSFLFAALFSVVVLPSSSLAEIEISSWNAAAEFNDSANPDAANPSGVWSYGWKQTLTDKFFLAVSHYEDSPSRFGWCNASGYPLIAHSVRAITAVIPRVYPVVFSPRTLFLHPGLNGEYAVLRFTAPADGSYKVSGQFYALDDHETGTTTDVWILPSNEKSSAFTGKIDFYGGAKCARFTSTTFELKKGNTLDFQVGYGANKNYEYDSTGLAALIEKIK